VTALRRYQHAVIAAFHKAVEEGTRRVLLCAPTGAGKTLIGADVIRDTARALRPVLVLAHRREIITQTSRKLHAAGIGHGIIQAGFQARPLELVQVASIATLWMRAMHRETMDLPPADLLWVDEAHHCPANTYRKIIDAYPKAVLLGTTATPCRGDGRGLGGIFDILIEVPQVAELIEQGFLVGTKGLCADRSRPARRRDAPRRLR
jgi:superfamily II DNA or RNA helicase